MGKIKWEKMGMKGHAAGSGDGDCLKWEVMWRRKLREKSRR